MRNQKPEKNQNNEKLTIERLKKFKGFENINDKEAEALISSYELFSNITYAIFQNKILKKTI